MSDNATWMGFWICIAFTICFTVALLVIPKMDKPSDNEIMVELVGQGISPAVVECINRNWNQIPEYEICKTVLTNNNLTREEAEELVNGLRE